MKTDRSLDVVVFGATGFTGRLVCDYLARRGKEEPTRWAIAGRNPDKLAAVRDRLAAVEPALAELPILVADSADRSSLEAMAKQTRVVLTTVGPYGKYGEPLVAACASTGTDYVDLTGEPGWWRDMIERYHATAEQTGARIVPACGFDSIPFDLGALFTARLLPPHASKFVRGYVAFGGRPSGGTWNTALSIMDEMSSKPRRKKAPSAPRAGKRPRPRGPHYAREVEAWVAPLPTIDPLIVRRSSQLCDGFGPEFDYHHYLQRGSFGKLATTIAGAGLVYSLAQFDLTRRALGRRIPPGTGPSPERRARSWFRAKFIGEADGVRVVTELRGGDPGYDETAKMIAESALCLAHDAEIPAVGGVLTTASAMGQSLIERLARAGLAFEVLEGP